MKPAVHRRKFLKQTFTGIVFLIAARFPIKLGFAFQREDQPSLVYFSSKESTIMGAIAGRIIGLDASDTLDAFDVVRRADVFMADADQEIQEQFHTLLNAFNAPFFTFLFDWRFSSFVSMSPDDQDSYLEDWMKSDFGFRRTGFQALKRLCLSMYYTDERSWKEIGYEGIFLPWER